jgi:uncharacterized protein YfaP (DUF2135 family)
LRAFRVLVNASAELGSLLVAALVASCASRDTGAVPPPPAADAAPGLRVGLTWSAPVDLDLYLTDPTWETAYFANSLTRSGARLEEDARCASLRPDAARVEIARVPEPAPGPYRVGVDFLDRCGTKTESVAYRITVDLDGMRREATGTVKFERFVVKALEFELRRSAEGAWEIVAASTP